MPLQPGALRAVCELKQARMEPSTCQARQEVLKVSYLIPGSEQFLSFFLPPKFINKLLQHPDTNPLLLNKMVFYHHAPTGRTSCFFTHITLTPCGKNIFLILPVSLNSFCRAAFAFIQDYLLLYCKCYLSSVTPHSSDERSKIRPRFIIINPVRRIAVSQLCH